MSLVSLLGLSVAWVSVGQAITTCARRVLRVARLICMFAVSVALERAFVVGGWIGGAMGGWGIRNVQEMEYPNSRGRTRAERFGSGSQRFAVIP